MHVKMVNQANQKSYEQTSRKGQEAEQSHGVLWDNFFWGSASVENCAGGGGEALEALEEE